MREIWKTRHVIRDAAQKKRTMSPAHESRAASAEDDELKRRYLKSYVEPPKDDDLLELQRFLEVILNQAISSVSIHPTIPYYYLQPFEKDMASFKQALASSLAGQYQRALDGGATPVEAVEQSSTALTDGISRLAGKLGRYQREFDALAVLLYHSNQGYSRYLFLSERGATTCDRCSEAHGQIVEINELLGRHMIPPLHPNCRCELVVMDARAEDVYNSNKELFIHRLDAAIDRRGKDEHGGVFLLDHSFFPQYYVDLPPQMLTRLTDQRGYILTDLSKPFGYAEPFRLPDTVAQAKELWAMIVAAQKYRSEHKLDSLGSFLAWLTLGIPSGVYNAQVSRAETLFEDINLYNLLNYLTIGNLEMVVGAIDPEEPYSLQHWMDMLGTALLIYGAYKTVASSGLDDDTLGVVDDALDDTVRAGTGVLDDILDDVARQDGRIVNVLSADDLNTSAIAKGREPPYLPGTSVYQIKLTGTTRFVRVYGGKSKQAGGWIMKADDIAGLTAEQIMDKFSLPQIPTNICDVEIPAGTILEVSCANGILGGSGSGVQYRFVSQYIREWFSNEQILP